tara:strand:+ start:3989 stop:4792 length:804 start_codon:yes stop_codon:yes gene_type:complete
MANSYVEYTSLSGTTYATPNFLNINDINVKGYNGSTWTTLTISSRDASAKTITLSAAPSSYQKIRVYRSTTADPLVDFTKGATLSESDLDSAYNQGLFVAQEVAENASLDGSGGVSNILNSQLAGGITNDKLAGSIAANKLAGGIDLTTQVTGYETGTFTPAVEQFSGTVTFSNVIYTRIGNIVHYSFKITNKSNTADNSQITINGFPFTMVGDHPASVGVNSSSFGHAMVSSGKMFFYSTTGGDFTYDNLAHTSGYIRVQGSYFIS